VAHPSGEVDLADVDRVAFERGDCTLALHSGESADAVERAPESFSEVADLRAAPTALRERGVEIGGIRQPAPGARFCGGSDPESNAFSLESRGSE